MENRQDNINMYNNFTADTPALETRENGIDYLKNVLSNYNDDLITSDAHCLDFRITNQHGKGFRFQPFKINKSKL